MSEDRETTLRRLKMRSMRRGIKEMDLILSAWADARLPDLPDEGIATYEALLQENDQDLYRWVTGQEPAPEAFAPMIADISSFTEKRAISRKTGAI